MPGHRRKADVHIEASSIADVSLGVLFSGNDALHARLKLTGNTIRGTLWWGEWRPGTIILADENSIFGQEGMPALSHTGRHPRAESERGLEVGSSSRATIQVVPGEGSGLAAATPRSSVPAAVAAPVCGAASEITAALPCSSEDEDGRAGQLRREDGKGARAQVPEERAETAGEGEDAMGERPGSIFDKTGHPEVRVRVQFSDFE